MRKMKCMFAGIIIATGLTIGGGCTKNETHNHYYGTQAQPKNAANTTIGATRAENVQKGTEMAENDIKEGKLGYWTLGFPAPEKFYIFINELEKYNILVCGSGDDIINEAEAAMAEGYNKVMEAAIQKKHGKDVVKEVMEKVLSGSQPDTSKGSSSMPIS